MMRIEEAWRIRAESIAFFILCFLYTMRFALRALQGKPDGFTFKDFAR